VAFDFLFGYVTIAKFNKAVRYLSAYNLTKLLYHIFAYKFNVKSLWSSHSEYI